MQFIIEFVEVLRANMSFSLTVQQSLGYYVYRLLDPKDDSTFYIGKGTGNRMFEHLNQALENKVSRSKKETKILDLLNSGNEPKYVIHRHGMDEKTAFEVEAALIDAYPHLLNDHDGHGNQERGARTLREIKEQYELKAMPTPDFPTLLINVNNISNRLDRKVIYNQVKGHWVLNPKNASKASYVIAVYRGIAIGIFQPMNWYASKLPRRYCFEGIEGPKEIWEKYVGAYGKRIDNQRLKNSQNPIKYFFP